ncbi:MAG: aldehyde dehydrogenase family protein [Planctomycetota bacterium]
MKLVANGNCTHRYGRTLCSGHWIDGRETALPKKAEAVFESRNPAEVRDLVGRFPLATRAETVRACEAAGAAFPKWARVPAPVRAEVIGRFAALLRQHKEMLSRLVTREIGKTLRESRGSVQEAIDTATFFQSEGRRLYGQTVPSELPRKELETFRRPLGVCAMITAGNFPVAVPSWKIVPAILCGNTVVWKPSDDAPATAAVFARLFDEAGLPPGVLNVVFGRGAGSAGEFLIEGVEKGLIQKVSFTGSSAVGRKIGEVCGRALQIPSLELGGKNPMIVMEDADLEQAVDAAVWAGFGTAGQRCTSLGNLILHRAIAKPFTQALLKRVAAIEIGDPTRHAGVLYGPMINARFLEGFLQHLSWGGIEGARLLTRPKGRITVRNRPRSFAGDADRGMYVFPAVWGGVEIGMKIAQTEIFGPTINLIAVRDFDEAMAVANGTPYGLSSAIYTRNPVWRMRFKTEIQAGMASVNNSTTGAEAHLPFGGVKNSGNGTRESGIWVIDAYTRWQAVNVDDSGGLQLAQIETAQVQAKAAVNWTGLTSGSATNRRAHGGRA